MDYGVLCSIPTLRPKLAYMPWLGGVGGPRIGVKFLEDDWFVFDEDWEVQRAMKDYLLGSRYPASYMETVESYKARKEAAEVLRDALYAPPDLNFRKLAHLVQDDLAIMEKDNLGEWRMTAASICFPSHWRLKEKFNQTIDVIHKDVGDDRFRAASVAAMDRVDERIVERFNWTLDATPQLRFPESGLLWDENFEVPGLTPYNAGSKLFIRYERQTLKLLPVTGALLFTIRVYLDPLRTLAEEHREHISDFVKAHKRHKTQGPWVGPMFAYLDSVL